MWMSKSGLASRSCSQCDGGKTMVGLIGLEPMTPALSRRCSNQLSYRPLAGAGRRWWRHGDSNPRHPACKAGALPTELYPLVAKEARCSIGKKKTGLHAASPSLEGRAEFFNNILSWARTGRPVRKAPVLTPGPRPSAGTMRMVCGYSLERR